MINVPTDLLRTLVAVVDHRSFTKAALSLGVTQPAVSAQIKRLQFLLECDVFDRSAPGVAVTRQGESVVNYARRILALNDQMMHLGANPREPEHVIRISTPSDVVAAQLPPLLSDFRRSRPGVRYHLRAGYYDTMMRDLFQGEIDIVVCYSIDPPLDARRQWSEEVVWVRSAATKLDPHRPIPLVSYGEKSVTRRLAVTVLKSAGLQWEDTFIGPNVASLHGAVVAGLGVMVSLRNRLGEGSLPILNDGSLPMLPQLYGGVYIREDGQSEAIERLADAIADLLRPKNAAAAGQVAELAKPADLAKVAKLA